ncbi:M20/M25/M40 family metallo-hydrolase [Parasegetibacter sp. NRK P23]|uniref:M20/M25/M40 family metallo-hydrolase n=1 Tax=Parasegetibacter sp. NRK P23 TaxID=2942999 RepID=UPI002044601B|nr:M20/M25/M40 family metallo-hydrolase [Parasegetibacter sp. NRK P23]MCM5529896.1 M20/M25/M40 family metallo-hydrolase [Parasegetibacter sp. NRK P23]
MFIKIFRPIGLLLGMSLLTTGVVNAQKLKKADKALVAALEAHVTFLASDQLEGRRTGTPGEEKAAAYIAGEFEKAGLQPGVEGKFEQVFTINEGKQVDPTSFLFINGIELKVHQDFFPLVYSAQEALESFPSMAIKEAGVPWFVELNEFVKSELEKNPHVDMNDAVRALAMKLEEKGATAVIFYEATGIKDVLKFEPKGNGDKPANIPLIVVKEQAASKFLKDHAASYEIKLKVKLSDKIRKGRNVVGIVDNNAPNTVVLGAHYDHLGYGEDGNSMIREGNPGIHNGADDNASGTAVLIELAKAVKAKQLKQYNYVFAAFSGEELGLIGSRYFTEHLPLKDKPLNYMVNMDMVGRLKSPENVITVGGYGTSPSWEKLVLNKKDKSLVVSIDSSGAGPSDHYSFYRINVPVLFFFTGTHQDYHKPSDDADKLNYTGMFLVERKIMDIVTAAEKEPKLSFLKTREKQTASSTSFKVTLGIMPDYVFYGTGVKIDGTTTGKPAEKAGLKKGDIVVKIGDLTISGMEDYMKALGSFEKGQQTTVVFVRDGKEMKAEVNW